MVKAGKNMTQRADNVIENIRNIDGNQCMLSVLEADIVMGYHQISLRICQFLFFMQIEKAWFRNNVVEPYDVHDSRIHAVHLPAVRLHRTALPRDAASAPTNSAGTEMSVSWPALLKNTVGSSGNV
jgi:hypothetical protein